MADTTNINERFLHHVSGNRAITVIVGIILVVLGVLFFTFPLAAMFFTNLFIIIGLAIYGIYLIISFVSTPSGYRDGWQLAMGIVLAISAIAILASNAAAVVVSLAVLLGVIAMMMGVNQIVGYSALRGTPGAGFILASGILNVILSLFLIASPFVAIAALGIVEGVYLCFAGIALVIEGLAKKKQKAQD